MSRMRRVVSGVALITVCGCTTHVPDECAPSYATVDAGGALGLIDEGDGSALRQACQALCGHPDCQAVDNTRLLCEPGCP
jgi:hypothetical protein